MNVTLVDSVDVLVRTGQALPAYPIDTEPIAWSELECRSKRCRQSARVLPRRI